MSAVQALVQKTCWGSQAGYSGAACAGHVDDVRVDRVHQQLSCRAKDLILVDLFPSEAHGLALEQQLELIILPLAWCVDGSSGAGEETLVGPGCQARGEKYFAGSIDSPPGATSVRTPPWWDVEGGRVSGIDGDGGGAARWAIRRPCADASGRGRRGEGESN